MIQLAFLLVLAAEPAPPAPPCDPLMTICDVLDPATGKARVWPADVARLQEDVETCLHFAGEEPYDAERRKEIEAAIDAHCGALERDLPDLRRKYKDDPLAQERLDAIVALGVG